MCLSTVYSSKPEAEDILLKNIQRFRAENGRLFFTDLMERTHEYNATLISADLVNGSIIIKLTEHS
jgi:hypothetical protein